MLGVKALLHYVFILSLIDNSLESSNKCGCRNLRKCYKQMLKELVDVNEVTCIENAASGTGTIMVFLEALRTYCGDIITVNSEAITYEYRALYEVEITSPNSSVIDGMDEKKVIIIEAGQDNSFEGVNMALFIIQQLVACMENEVMLNNLLWVILPSSNPDGLEFARLSPHWNKNVRKFEDKDNLGFGVDITRNFDAQWEACEQVSPFTSLSKYYSGPYANSENETIFISNILRKYDKRALTYISIRGNGHGIFRPFAYGGSSKQLPNEDIFKKMISYLSVKANKKIGNIESFMDMTIKDYNINAHCGHSVDFAQQLGINSVEWRVFFHLQNPVYLSKYHSVPKNYHSILRNGYFSLLKEAHNVYLKFDKFKKYFLNDFDKEISVK